MSSGPHSMTRRDDTLQVARIRATKSSQVICLSPGQHRRSRLHCLLMWVRRLFELAALGQQPGQVRGKDRPDAMPGVGTEAILLGGRGTADVERRAPADILHVDNTIRLELPGRDIVLICRCSP